MAIEEEVAFLDDYVSDSVDHRGTPAGKLSTGGWRSAWYIIGEKTWQKHRIFFFSWNFFYECFFFLNIFRCRGRRKICLLWDCLQLNYLPHRTSRSIDGNRRRKRELLVRNSLDASCCRSFRSRRLYWSLPNHSDSFSHLHTRMFLLQLQVIILIDLKTKQ